MSDEVVRFLKRHENKPGAIGEFIRSCLIVAEQSEFMSRDELKESAQMGYLLDCFPTCDETDE